MTMNFAEMRAAMLNKAETARLERKAKQEERAKKQASTGKDDRQARLTKRAAKLGPVWAQFVKTVETINTGIASNLSDPDVVPELLDEASFRMEAGKAIRSLIRLVQYKREIGL